MVTEATKLKDTCSLGKKSYEKQQIKHQRYHFADNGPYSQSTFFPVVMYGYESWTIKRLSAEELMLLNCFFLEK